MAEEGSAGWSGQYLQNVRYPVDGVCGEVGGGDVVVDEVEVDGGRWMVGVVRLKMRAMDRPSASLRRVGSVV